MSHFDDALSALSGRRWAISEAPGIVPARPGLYAIFGDEQAWTELGLESRISTPLYVGKAEESLARRELQAHFAVNPGAKTQTGSSTVRRSFGALLRDRLGLRAQPRNTDRPAGFTMYGLSPEHDRRLTEWMHARLSVAFWPIPIGLREPLKYIETNVIRRWTPSINLTGNPSPARGLKAARAVMAAEASRWRAAEPSRAAYQQRSA